MTMTAKVKSAYPLSHVLQQPHGCVLDLHACGHLIHT
jgi:hypothetical protein